MGALYLWKEQGSSTCAEIGRPQTGKRSRPLTDPLTGACQFVLDGKAAAGGAWKRIEGDLT